MARKYKNNIVLKNGSIIKTVALMNAHKQLKGFPKMRPVPINVNLGTLNKTFSAYQLRSGTATNTGGGSYTSTAQSPYYPLPGSSGGSTGPIFSSNYEEEEIKKEQKKAKEKMEKELKASQEEEKFEQYFNEAKSFTAKDFMERFEIPLSKSYEILNEYKDKSALVRNGDKWILNPNFYSDYVDWNGNLSKLETLHKLKIFTLLIGPKGSGKNQSVIALAKKLNLNMYCMNLSLRTREQHILGRLDTTEDAQGNKSITWKKGQLPLSMEEGAILIVDEMNAAEPDVLLRLDEAFDERRELNYEGQHIVANPNWWVVGIINPLDHPGTKELPPQMLRRFPARLIYNYPDPITELKIVRRKEGIKQENESRIYSMLELFDKIRNNSEMPYKPSVSESLTAAKLLNNDISMNDVIDLTLINSLKQWGEEPMSIVRELAISKGLYVENEVIAKVKAPKPFASV